jgi:hypothetical protein
MGEDKLIAKTLLKVEIENKVNDMCVKERGQELFIADTGNVISKLTIRY